MTFIFFLLKLTKKKTTVHSMRVSLPHAKVNHTFETVADYLLDKTPACFHTFRSWVQLRGCQGCLWQPWFLSDKCKNTKGSAESKESDLVYVAHTEINKKCQMFQICSNSHADEPTFHFWNTFTQHHKIINIFFPHLDSREPDVYCHMLDHSFQQNA